MTDTFSSPGTQLDPFKAPGQSLAVEGDLSADGKFYMLSDPDKPGSRKSRRTRATTFASALSETYNLNNWKIRKTAEGLVKRDDLFTQLSMYTDWEDNDTKKKVQSLCEQAQTSAGSRRGANLGTALHAFTERTDRGEPVDVVPVQYRPDIMSYQHALTQAGLEVLPGYIERRILVKKFNVAGTLDRIVRDIHTGELFILDVKTAKDLSFAIGEIKVQLALYANADWLWHPDTQTWERPPPVDRKRALIAWMPVGKGVCQILTVDIQEGWKAATLCDNVRKWRSKKGTAEPWVPSVPAIGADGFDIVPTPEDQPLAIEPAPVIDPEQPNVVLHTVDTVKPLAEQAELEYEIGRAKSRQELAMIYMDNQGVWTESMTDLGKARLAELNQVGKA